MKNVTVSLSNPELLALSHEVRKSVFEICLNANNGHIGGCSGAVELLVTLYFGGILHYGHSSMPNDDRDRVLVRGTPWTPEIQDFFVVGLHPRV